MATLTDVNIRGLGSVGLITDKPPHELPANVWTIGNNVRFRDNVVERIGGYANLMPSEPQEPKGLTYFNNRWQWGSSDTLYEFEPDAPTTHQPRYTVPVGEEVADADKWTFNEFSGILITSHPEANPVYWDGNTPGPTSYQVLPGWGYEFEIQNNWKTKRLRTFKNQVIALNLTEEGIEYPQRIRWSDIAPPNNVPQSWDAASTTNSAGFLDLSNATGPIVDGRVLGDSFAIYTKNEVYMMDFVGGNDIYAIRQVFNDMGAIQEGCIASYDNKHLVVAVNDVYIHNGSTKQSVITNKIKGQFFEQVADFEYDAQQQYEPHIEAITYTALNEIWIFYTTDIQEGTLRTYYRKAVIWNYADDTWSFVDVPQLTDIANGGIPLNQVLRWDNADTWDPERPDMTWDESDPLIWDGGGKDIEERILIGCGQKGFQALDQQARIADQLYTVTLERQKIDLDEELQGLGIDKHKTVMSIYPQFNGKGKVNIRIGYSYEPNAAPTWSPPVTFDIETDYKADFRVTGRYLSVSVDALDTGDWTFEGWMWKVGGIQQSR